MNNKSFIHTRHEKDNILREGGTRSIKTVVDAERRKKNQKARLFSFLFDLIDLLALFGVYAGIISYLLLLSSQTIIYVRWFIHCEHVQACLGARGTAGFLTLAQC